MIMSYMSCLQTKDAVLLETETEMIEAAQKIREEGEQAKPDAAKETETESQEMVSIFHISTV